MRITQSLLFAGEKHQERAEDSEGSTDDDDGEGRPCGRAQRATRSGRETKSVRCVMNRINTAVDDYDDNKFGIVYFFYNSFEFILVERNPIFRVRTDEIASQHY